VSWPPRLSTAALSRLSRHVTWGVFYNQADLKPHTSRYWLNAEPDTAAAEKMADITSLYKQAPPVFAVSERVLSTDEMPGNQALERTHPTIPMGPGREERRAFEDIVISARLY